jgi:hypothetical protein
MPDPAEEFRHSPAPVRHVFRSLEEVFLAWNDAGPVPAHHRREKARLRAEWPALAGALDQLTAVVLQDPEPRP